MGDYVPRILTGGIILFCMVFCLTCCRSHSEALNVWVSQWQFHSLLHFARDDAGVDLRRTVRHCYIYDTVANKWWVSCVRDFRVHHWHTPYVARDSTSGSICMWPSSCYTLCLHSRDKKSHLASFKHQCGPWKRGNGLPADVAYKRQNYYVRTSRISDKMIRLHLR